MLGSFLARNGLHSVVVHFPVILLLAAPIWVIVGATVSAAERRLFLGLALAFMVLGTGMTFLAVATGELARKGVASRPGFNDLVNQHQSLAVSTREMFSALTPGFAALLFFSELLGRDLKSWVRTAMFAAFLLFYVTGDVLLIDTSIKGDRLVQMLGAKTAVTCNLPRKRGP
jgi:uncharacterized membrane protein